MSVETYGDQFCDWLVEEGYTHCFFVAGGNVMHLLNSARKRFTCVPVIHEVAASIAVEYFNESSEGNKAFALVTAGPGITNAITGIAGAWLESREMLIIGGQVKSSDLASPELRQRGIQEINGIALTESITKMSLQITAPLPKQEIMGAIRLGRKGRPGPIFIEFCLDAQGAAPIEIQPAKVNEGRSLDQVTIIEDISAVLELLENSVRPVFLIGAGVSRYSSKLIVHQLSIIGIPIMTTWNALDRIDSSEPLYWGRPNTWGQRSANILIQQSDLIIAIGTRLGLQQTGFNWQGFAPIGKVVQVDIDAAELMKTHPHVDVAINADANVFISEFIKSLESRKPMNLSEWHSFGKLVRDLVPNNEDSNNRDPGFINPYDFVDGLSENLTDEDLIIPCSSGGAFTTMMQGFAQKIGQKVITNKGLASMGYGLSGAIGAAYANPGRNLFLIEGDGGFAQNLQEIGTVASANLSIKFFIYDNGGYASIKMTQKNYFGGAYVGCDRSTGLGLPKWEGLFGAFGVEVTTLDPINPFSPLVLERMRSKNPSAFIVPINPDQTYFPKITSQVLPNGQMESNPLHLMTPALTEPVLSAVFKYI